MEDKKFVILIYGGMGLLLSGLLLMLFFSIRSGSSREKNTVPYDEIKTINPDDKIFSSKSQAYQAADRDSFLSVREENLNVDFSKLFKDEKGGSDKGERSSDEREQKSEPVESTGYTQPVKTSSARDNAPAGGSLKSSVSRSVSAEQPSGGVTAEPLESHEPQRRREGFYSAEVSKSEDKSLDNISVFRCVVHQQQEAYQGSTVKLRTVSPLQAGDITIPVNTFIYGIATLVQERVRIRITSVVYDGKMYPVKLSVFDRDGIEGIYVPGLLLHELSKETARDVSSEVDINVPYVGRVPVDVSRKKIEKQSAVLTDGYEIILK